MNLQKIILFFLILVSSSIASQNMVDYTDNWEGRIENPKVFNLNVEIENLDSTNPTFRLSNSKEIVRLSFASSKTSLIEIQFTEKNLFRGVLSKNGKEINGFIRSGLLLYHLKLTKNESNIFQGIWKVLMVDELKSENLFLSIENGVDDDYQAYPIFADDRFTGTWCDNFKKSENKINFSDFKTGLQFEGQLLGDKIVLGIYLGQHLITEVYLQKSIEDWKIGGFNSDKIASKIHLSEMENLIANKKLPNTHSVLISQKGKLIYENYFDGYHASIPHDMRSSSKSISSAIVGIAKDQKLIKGLNQSIFEFLSKDYQNQKNSLKSKIDLQSLLTMSSGLDAIDYGLNANPKSSATEDNYQMSKDWIASVLNAEMINTPNTVSNYGSANPFLLGIVMDSVVSEPLELFMDRNLFRKLGVSNYIIQTDLNGIPYLGGGMYLTSRDMLKFGQLYLNEGKYNKNRILSKSWVRDSFKDYRVLENTADKNGYGYLWWHSSYELNGKTIKTIEARGAGGQYIFVIPDLKMVVIITSGNYRNGKTQQPESILQNYILPQLIKE